MKITPEIEAVARAIRDINPINAMLEWDDPVNNKDQYYEAAIAAIRALGEPTSRQIVAGLHGDLGPYDVAASYTAMIDAALGENE